MAFHRQVDTYDTDSLIVALGELRRFLGGQKATLLWDGLPAHRSKAMRAWLRRQRSWLVVEPLPGYAPELNPVEALWSNLKGVELANLAGDTSSDVITAAEPASSGSAAPTPGLLVPSAQRPVALVSMSLERAKLFKGLVLGHFNRVRRLAAEDGRHRRPPAGRP